jgi:prephenate dehydrogenase
MDEPVAAPMRHLVMDPRFNEEYSAEEIQRLFEAQAIVECTEQHEHKEWIARVFTATPETMTIYHVMMDHTRHDRIRARMHIRQIAKG